jgi:hypothetical protein
MPIAEKKGGGSLAALLVGKPKMPTVEEDAEMEADDDVAQTAGVDAMSAMFDAIDSRDPAGAFEALKDAIAAANR